jgi:hypothetical protein
MPSGINIIGQYKYILTNNAQELTPSRLEFKSDTQIDLENNFLSTPKFKPGSLG